MDATTAAVHLAKTVFEIALANAQWPVTGRQRLARAGFGLPDGDGADSCRDGSMRDGALLGPRRAATRPPRNAGASGVCAAVRATQQDGSRRRGGDSGGGTLGAGADRGREAGRAAGAGRPAPSPRAVNDDPHRPDQYAARDSSRAGDSPAGGRARRHDVDPYVLEDAATVLSSHFRHVLTAVHDEVRAIERRIAALKRKLGVLAEQDAAVTRLRTTPGIGC